MLPPRAPISKELAVILATLLLLLFTTPMANWWATGAIGWLAPYALWFLVILGTLFMHRWDDSDGP